MVRTFSNGKNMRRDLIPPLATVDSNSSHGVDRKPLVGVDRDTEEARVCVNELFNIAHLQVEQDRSIVKVGQVGHVLTQIILRRIHLRDELKFSILKLPILYNIPELPAPAYIPSLHFQKPPW